MVSGALRVGAGVILEYPRVGYARGFDSGFGPLHFGTLSTYGSVPRTMGSVSSVALHYSNSACNMLDTRIPTLHRQNVPAYAYE